MKEDIRAAMDRDPAARSAFEVLALYPGLHALWWHRVAHFFYCHRWFFIARLISQVNRFFTQIEIHPGAVIGRRFFIDHGMGVVIGETAVVGDDVMMYHGVTLGGHGWWADAKGAKRHPTIGNHVTLGVRCSVLGPVVVGEHCRIGPHALVVDDVPARSVVVVARGHCVTLARARVEEPTDEERLPATWMTGGEEDQEEDVPDGRV